MNGKGGLVLEGFDVAAATTIQGSRVLRGARVNPPLPPSPLSFNAATFSARPLLPTTLSTIRKPNQSRNPHSADAHRGDGSVATLQLASVSVLASYSGGLRPSLPSLCLPARVTRKRVCRGSKSRASSRHARPSRCLKAVPEKRDRKGGPVEEE